MQKVLWFLAVLQIPISYDKIFSSTVWQDGTVLKLFNSRCKRAGCGRLWLYRKERVQSMGDKKTDAGLSEAASQIVSYMDCPYQIFTKENTAEDVIDGYRQSAERGKTEGFTPLLVVVSDTIAETLEFSEQDSYSKEDAIRQPAGRGEELLKEWQEDYMEDYMDDAEGEMALEELMGEKIEGETINELSSFESYVDDGIEETLLFEIPTENPWEVIAWVPMGGWNECPAAEEMTAVCRYWYETYGAVPALVSSDTLEFVLNEPVSDEEEARKVAKEHYVFCHDRVDQGTETGTIGEVADCISKSNVWFFWWD